MFSKLGHSLMCQRILNAGEFAAWEKLSWWKLVNISQEVAHWSRQSRKAKIRRPTAKKVNDACDVKLNNLNKRPQNVKFNTWVNLIYFKGTTETKGRLLEQIQNGNFLIINRISSCFNGMTFYYWVNIADLTISDRKQSKSYNGKK